MKNYKDYIISKGGKEIGILYEDVKEYLLTPNQLKEFDKYIANQTCASLSDAVGLFIVYTGDYERFIKGLPNND